MNARRGFKPVNSVTAATVRVAAVSALFMVPSLVSDDFTAAFYTFDPDHGIQLTDNNVASLHEEFVKVLRYHHKLSWNSLTTKKVTNGPGEARWQQGPCGQRCD